MIESLKQYFTLLQFLYHCKVHTLLFSVTLQNRLQYFAYTSATWKNQTQLMKHWLEKYFFQPWLDESETLVHIRIHNVQNNK